MRTVLKPEWVIDGTGASPLVDHIVALSGGVVDGLYAGGDFREADGDVVVDLPGMTLLPGLINNHVHLVLPGDNTPFTPWMDLQSDAALALQAVHNAQVSLEAGVTTVRDCGGRSTVVLDTRDALSDGLVKGASIVSCGWTLTITGGHTRQFGGEVDGPVDVTRAVRKVVASSADFVKVMAAGGGTPGSLPHYPSFTVEELRAIVDTAHGLGRLVSAHCIATSSIEYAIDAGVDLIEHAAFQAADGTVQFDHRIAEKLARSGIAVTPTLQVYRDLADQLAEGSDRSRWQYLQETQRQCVARLHELGVPLLAGSDAGWRATAFNTFWKELDELHECGLSPVEVVHSSTGAVAHSLGKGKEFGTVQPGRRADIVAVAGELAADVRRVREVKLVIQAGHIVSSSLPGTSMSA